MRKMMEGVILYGTGRGVAQLNGYSAGGKTGTAQKIDPRTHTYSKTNFVASFVGFAPVNNPAITIAVVMDSPDHAFHFGAEASAPLFHDLAQQILEYLGVPHDEPMQSPAAMAKAQEVSHEEEPAEHVDDLDSLFAEVNNLPADDPLRASQPAQARVPVAKAPIPQTEDAPLQQDQKLTASLRKPTLPETVQPAQSASQAPSPPESIAQTIPTDKPPSLLSTGSGSVVVASGMRVAVPSFAGEPVRKVIEQAGGIGLGVQVLGTGIARGQAPAAGTMVPAGTEVVVRFGR
jgi:cell division protein FtsI (penicillin-binding protein 3)